MAERGTPFAPSETLTLNELEPQHPFAVAFLVVVLALIGIFLALGEHRVDQPRELMGRSGDCLCLIHARAHADRVDVGGATVATERQRPGAGFICNSNLGSQDAAEAYRKQLVSIKAIQSMSRTSCCYDNSPMKSSPRS